MPRTLRIIAIGYAFSGIVKTLMAVANVAATVSQYQNALGVLR